MAIYAERKLRIFSLGNKDKGIPPHECGQVTAFGPIPVTLDEEILIGAHPDNRERSAAGLMIEDDWYSVAPPPKIRLRSKGSNWSSRQTCSRYPPLSSICRVARY